MFERRSCFCSVAQLCLTLQLHELQHTRLPCPSPSCLLKLKSIESVMPSKHLILCRPLFLLLSIFPSIRVFSNESVLCMRWPKHWNFSFSTSPSKKYSGLISFRIDWFDFLAVQGTPRHHNLKASVLQCSAYFMVQLSHSYMTTGKTIVLTIQTLVGKVIISAFS